MNTNVRNLTRDELSPSELRLVEIMSALNYGIVDSFPVRNGQPVLDPEPEIELRDRVGCERSNRRSVWNGRYLHPMFSGAIRQIREMGDGTVSWIDVQDGLPHRVFRRPVSY
ncbi:MAG: hypothetical protein ACYC2Y_00010 [Armatimonadota bacterium]